MLRVVKSLAVAAFAVGLFAASAQTAAAQDRAGLIGSWNCRITSPTNDTNIITTYLPDGDFISYGKISDTTNGPNLEFAMVGEGNWSLQGNVLTETATTFDLIWGKLNGQPIIPATQIWVAMVNAMNGTLNQPNVRTVEGLTATSLSVDYQGTDLTCTRP